MCDANDDAFSALRQIFLPTRTPCLFRPTLMATAADGILLASPRIFLVFCRNELAVGKMRSKRCRVRIISAESDARSLYITKGEGVYSLMELSWSVPLQRQRDKIAEICYQRAEVSRSASEGSDEVPPRYVGRSLCCAAAGDFGFWKAFGSACKSACRE